MAALIAEDQHQQEEADAYFQRALESIGRTGFQEAETNINFSYAELLKARGDFERAVEYYRAALQSRKTLRRGRDMG